MYQVYRSGWNASVTLSLLSLGILSVDMCFILKNMDMVKRHNNGVYVKRLTSNEFEVNYYRKLEKVIELQYHIQHNRVFLSKCYWYDTTNREIIVEPLSWFGRNLFKG
jgi:hypothetical protein